jgi:hypothetical protein
VGSYAERDITYNVISQYRMVMSAVKIQERLLPASGSPCPNGTEPQNGLCVGKSWANETFPDTLLANALTGNSEYTQTFWVATLPNRPGYAAFYGPIPVQVYQLEPSPSNSLIETQFVIKVNGNTGMNPNGTPQRCGSN